MASYKIITDSERRIPVAVPSYVSGELIAETFNKKNNGPTTQSTASTPVQVDQNGKDVKMSVIDVVKNYDWKVSPNNSIVEHPYIILEEYRIDKSPLLAQLSYNVKAGIESIGAGLRATTAIAAAGASQNEVVKKIEGMLKYVGDKVEEASNFLQTGIENIENETGAVEEKLEGVLKPFQGLYYLKKTNFTYKLPYFSRKMTVRTNSWQPNFPGESAITNLLQDGINKVATYGAGIPLLGAYAEPGIYIERGKYFNPTPGGDPISIKFPLLNTLNSDSLQKNFNLIWLLSFQNSSIRRNKTDVFPPCIYRVLIPGVRYILYASVELVIEYVGTRRRMPIVHPATGETVDIAIPEAYNIEINIESLTTECGNFLLKSLSNVL
jgi:hypothetical protein